MRVHSEIKKAFIFLILYLQLFLGFHIASSKLFVLSSEMSKALLDLSIILTDLVRSGAP